MAGTTKAKTTTAKASTSSNGFSAAEKAAMKERSAELRTEKRAGSRAAKAAEAEAALLAKIADMPEADRVIAEKIHSIVTTTAPELAPRLWYGMPAYAKDGKVLCFFQDAAKFEARYATFGFNDPANLDEATMWPTTFAITKLTPADEKKIAALVKRAVS